VNDHKQRVLCRKTSVESKVNTRIDLNLPGCESNSCERACKLIKNITNSKYRVGALSELESDIKVQHLTPINSVRIVV